MLQTWLWFALLVWSLLLAWGLYWQPAQRWIVSRALIVSLVTTGVVAVILVWKVLAPPDSVIPLGAVFMFPRQSSGNVDADCPAGWASFVSGYDFFNYQAPNPTDPKVAPPAPPPPGGWPDVMFCKKL